MYPKLPIFAFIILLLASFASADCGPAAKTYDADDTQFAGEFCSEGTVSKDGDGAGFSESGSKETCYQDFTDEYPEYEHLESEFESVDESYDTRSFQPYYIKPADKVSSFRFYVPHSAEKLLFEIHRKHGGDRVMAAMRLNQPPSTTSEQMFNTLDALEHNAGDYDDVKDKDYKMKCGSSLKCSLLFEPDAMISEGGDWVYVHFFDMETGESVDLRYVSVTGTVNTQEYMDWYEQTGGNPEKGFCVSRGSSQSSSSDKKVCSNADSKYEEFFHDVNWEPSSLTVYHDNMYRVPHQNYEVEAYGGDSESMQRKFRLFLPPGTYNFRVDLMSQAQYDKDVDFIADFWYGKVGDSPENKYTNDRTRKNTLLELRKGVRVHNHGSITLESKFDGPLSEDEAGWIYVDDNSDYMLNQDGSIVVNSQIYDKWYNSLSEEEKNKVGEKYCYGGDDSQSSSFSGVNKCNYRDSEQAKKYPEYKELKKDNGWHDVDTSYDTRVLNPYSLSNYGEASEGGLYILPGSEREAVDKIKVYVPGSVERINLRLHRLHKDSDDIFVAVRLNEPPKVSYEELSDYSRYDLNTEKLRYDMLKNPDDYGDEDPFDGKIRKIRDNFVLRNSGSLILNLVSDFSANASPEGDWIYLHFFNAETGEPVELGTISASFTVNTSEYKDWLDCSTYTMQEADPSFPQQGHTVQWQCIDEGVLSSCTAERSWPHDINPLRFLVEDKASLIG